jgi:hypothetical protein
MILKGVLVFWKGEIRLTFVYWLPKLFLFGSNSNSKLVLYACRYCQSSDATI